MNLFDAIAILMVVVGLLTGYRSGALPQIFAWLGVALFVVAAFLLLPLAQPTLEDLDPFLRGLAALGVVFAAFALGQGVGSAIGWRLRRALGRGLLGDLDRIAGAVVGAAEAVLIIWLASGLITAIPDARLAREARGSEVLRRIGESLPPPTILTARVGRLLDESGIPRLFIGLEPPRSASTVPPPADPRAQAIARPAIPSAVEVKSSACGQGFVGSGFVVRPGYVVTNAHVVAGGSAITAETDADRSDATVVAFDPELDVALLHVPQLDAPPIRLSASVPSSGTQAVALGHPRGRALALVPASVTASYSATGRDIYGEGTVTRRIIELRGHVERGESGGPLVLPDGTVGGVIFGGAIGDPEVAYALAPTDVARRIAPGLGSTTPVSTGACIG